MYFFGHCQTKHSFIPEISSYPQKYHFLQLLGSEITFVFQSIVFRFLNRTVVFVYRFKKQRCKILYIQG